MAKALRQALAERGTNLSHGECLDLVARQFGLRDWNTLSARIEAQRPGGVALTLPEGWSITGHTNRRNYSLGLDPDVPGCARIECHFARSSGVDLGDDRFACMMQSVAAREYIGRKIRLAAQMRVEDADEATIWLRVDERPGRVLRFDNMMDRPEKGALKGTTSWAEREIVLDVPQNAGSLHYGFFLKGFGKVWARGFRLEIVEDERAVTEMPRPVREKKLLPQPFNLGFRR